jgi:hypothetical protein
VYPRASSKTDDRNRYAKYFAPFRVYQSRLSAMPLLRAYRRDLKLLAGKQDTDKSEPMPPIDEFLPDFILCLALREIFVPSIAIWPLVWPHRNDRPSFAVMKESNFEELRAVHSPASSAKSPQLIESRSADSRIASCSAESVTRKSDNRPFFILTMRLPLALDS